MSRCLARRQSTSLYPDVHRAIRTAHVWNAYDQWMRAPSTHRQGSEVRVLPLFTIPCPEFTFDRSGSSLQPQMSLPHTGQNFPRTSTVRSGHTFQRTGTLPYTSTQHTYQSMRNKHRNFGGFPMPYEVASRAIDYFFPNFKRTLTRTVTTVGENGPSPDRGSQRVLPLYVAHIKRYERKIR